MDLQEIEIKYLLKAELIAKVNDREIYMKDIDHNYYYEGYTMYKIQNL